MWLCRPIIGIKQDEHGFTLVNLKSHWRTNEPYVFASQAVQVFYTPKSEKNRHVVITTKPRDLFEMEEDVIPEADLLQASNSSMVYQDGFNDAREDIGGSH